jgi:hypothetical protein
LILYFLYLKKKKKKRKKRMVHVLGWLFAC